MPRWTWILMLASSVLLPSWVRAEPDEGSKTYQKVLKSIVWIQSQRGPGRMATGSGTLIDKQRRLVLTNFHVVGTNDRATVVFPAYRDGKLIAERDYYTDRLRRDGGIRARVIARDRTHDLAVLQLDSLPESAQALPIAPESVMPGQQVHSVGNPGDSGALWVYTPGKVRQVYHKKWKAKVGDDTLSFEADVVETDSATNPGDSGGPLVNDKAQLVGVTQGGAVGARLLSTFIDVGEVKTLLNSRDVKGAGAEPAAVNVPPAPEKPRAFEVRDAGKFFTEDAIKKANEEIAELTKKYSREILVETFPAPPEDKAEKVKAMNKEERAKFFKDWAHDRVKAENLHGVYMLVCREPSHLYFDVVGAKTRSVLDEEYTQRIITKMLGLFREKKYDEGLLTMLKMVRERLEDPIANP